MLFFLPYIASKARALAYWSSFSINHWSRYNRQPDQTAIQTEATSQEWSHHGTQSKWFRCITAVQVFSAYLVVC